VALDLKISAVLASRDGAAVGGAYGPSAVGWDLKIAAVPASRDGAAVRGAYGPSAVSWDLKIAAVLGSRDGAAVGGAYGPSAVGWDLKIGAVLASRDGSAVGGAYGPSAVGWDLKIAAVLASRDGSAVGGAYGSSAGGSGLEIGAVLASRDGEAVGGAYGPAAAATYHVIADVFDSGGGTAVGGVYSSAAVAVYPKIAAVRATRDGTGVGGAYGPAAAATYHRIAAVFASGDGTAVGGAYGPAAVAMASDRKIAAVLPSGGGTAIWGTYGPAAAAVYHKIAAVLALGDGTAVGGAYGPAAAAAYKKIAAVLATGDGTAVGGACGPADVASDVTIAAVLASGDGLAVGRICGPAAVASSGADRVLESGAAAGGTSGPSASAAHAWGPAPAAPGLGALALVRSDSVIYNVHENATSNSDGCTSAVGIGVAKACCCRIPAPPALITSGSDVLSPTRGAEVGRSHVPTTKELATSGDGVGGLQGTATTMRPFTASISDWDGRRVWPWRGESGGDPRPTASTRGAEWSLTTRSHAGAQDGTRWARGARVPRFILNYVPSVSPVTYHPPLPSTIERIGITCYSDSALAVCTLSSLEMGWPDDEDYLFTRTEMGLPYAAGLFEADTSDTGTEADSFDSYGSMPDLIPPEEQDSDSSSLSTGASASHRRRLSPTCVGEIDGRKRSLADFSATPEYSGVFPRQQPIVVWASDALSRPDALSRQGADGSESSDDSLDSARAEPPVGAAGAAAPAETRYYSDGSDEEDSDERWRDEIVDSDA